MTESDIDPIEYTIHAKKFSIDVVIELRRRAKSLADQGLLLRFIVTEEVTYISLCRDIKKPRWIRSSYISRSWPILDVIDQLIRYLRHELDLYEKDFPNGPPAETDELQFLIKNDKW